MSQSFIESVEQVVSEDPYQDHAEDHAEDRADHSDVVIPCELCDEPVWYSAYASHTLTCMHRDVFHSIQPNQVLLQRLLDITGPGGSVVVLGVPPDPRRNTRDLEEDENGEGEGEGEGAGEGEGEGEGGGEGETDDANAQTSRLWTQLAHTLASASASASSPSFATAVSFRGDYERNSLIAELMGGPHRVGVSSINSVSSVISSSRISLLDMCPICQDTPQGVVRETMCGHIFCGDCITTWLTNSKKCPVCMMELQPSVHPCPGPCPCPVPCPGPSP